MDTLYEITHTTQIFEPELISLLYNRKELLLDIMKKVSKQDVVQTYCNELHAYACEMNKKNHNEIVKQVFESF